MIFYFYEVIIYAFYKDRVETLERSFQKSNKKFEDSYEYNKINKNLTISKQIIYLYEKFEKL